ncbi:Rpn family recombination-promoting nuclease/putative transposase [Rickettsia endosymbiont of Halotydeus destructor]|uniref:Rpn family recombination-promoting nuclease/putative transposase n=1 Tax=Rickettsia endosymbiont of Halotydeus destructor TaxID=2996754 RepID=UPI003BAECCD4
MSKITPKIDIAFKKIFGVEENKDLLISLINSIVSEEDLVTDITLLNPYNPANFRNDKLSILDIKAEGHDGKRLNIEIQITNDAEYDKRALYYWAKLYTEQLKTGSDYSKLSKAIGIHILNFTSVPGTDKYHNVFHIREKDSGIKYFKDLELHTLELKKFSPNYEEELSDIVVKVKNSLDRWLTFLTRNDLLNKNNLPEELNDIHIKKALNVLDIMNFSDEEREAYEDHLKWLMTEASALNTVREEGRVEGRVEGIAIGEAKVREEKITLAKKMLVKNKSLDEIIEFTGLTEEEIKNIK